MDGVGVWSGDRRLFQQLMSRLGTKFHFLAGTHPADLLGTPLDLLVITPTASSLSGAGVLRPRLALLPGENLPLARRVSAASAVSYGLGRRNTLTLSSLKEDRAALALQREVITLSGRTLERQEWVVPSLRLPPEELLCLTGALLLLDQPPG